MSYPDAPRSFALGDEYSRGLEPKRQRFLWLTSFDGTAAVDDVPRARAIETAVHVTESELAADEQDTVYGPSVEVHERLGHFLTLQERERLGHFLEG
jgi:hypothetical protein